MKDLFSLEAPSDFDRLQAAWEEVLKRLSPEIPSAWFERFIRPLTPVAFDQVTAVLAVPGRFVQEWVKERYIDTIQSMLSDEMGQSVSLDFRPEPQAKAAVPRVTASVPRQSAVTEEPTFRPSEKYSFSSFVAGQSNRLALAGCRAVAKEPGTKYNPLFIYGPSGLGKTHLLHAIAREVFSLHPRYPLVYVSAQQFAEEFVTALQSNRMEAFRRSQRSVGIWLVDDIQFIAGKDKTQEEIFHTFNYLHSLGKQIVITSDRPPRDLYSMDERLRSRFEAGLVADIQMPDTETRCAILLEKARHERITLDMTVAMYLAESVPGNIRVLEGALTKVAAQASVLDDPITLDIATAMVEKYYRKGVLEKPGFEQIVTAVSRHFNIPTDEIKGLSRKAPIVQARHVAVYITREITGNSWKHIGGLFGDRDHTSMMHGYQKIWELMHHDKDLRTQVKSLIRNLYPSDSAQQ